MTVPNAPGSLLGFDREGARLAQAKTHAQAIARTLSRQLDQTSPATELATVADASRAFEYGYLTATATRGPIRVVGLPPGQPFVPGMRILVRRMRADGQQAYVYDGLAPGSKPVTSTGGALLRLADTELGAVSNQVASPLPFVAGTSPYGESTFPGWLPSNVGNYPNYTPAVGFYYSFFFNLSRLPAAGGVYVLLEHDRYSLDTSFGNPTSGQATIETSLQIGVRSDGAIFVDGTATDFGIQQGFGGVQPAAGKFSSATPIAPGRTYFLTVVLGLGVAINGVWYSDNRNDPQTVLSVAGQTSCIGTAGVGSDGYGLIALADNGLAKSCPAGTWMSKLTVGSSNSGAPGIGGTGGGTALWPFAVVTDPTGPGQGFIPTKDGDLTNGVNGNFGHGVVTYHRYLMGDYQAATIFPGGLNSERRMGNFPDTGAGHGGSCPAMPLQVYSYGGKAIVTGPY